MPKLRAATSIVQKLTQAGHLAYFAGGWVRDYLMQHPSDDIDIATSAQVEEIQALFPKTIPVGIAFGIVIVVEGGHPFEVATFRKESGYLDGRRPTSIERATPEEDAQRRDFTINGMFWDPLKRVLHDYVEGQADIQKRVIRAIGDPHERFLEDRLRMMRAVRYSTRFHFPIELDTEQAIVSHAESLLPAVAMERVWQEFKKLAQFGHVERALLELHRLHLLGTIFSELKAVSLEEVATRLSPLPHFPKDTPPILQLLPLFPDTSLEQKQELCERLKLSKAERVSAEFFHHAQQMLMMPHSWSEGLTLAEWAHFYAHSLAPIALQCHAASLPSADREVFLQEHGKRNSDLTLAIVRIQTKAPLVNADDLAREGIAPGPKMGALLKEAERVSINLKLHTREAVIAHLKTLAAWHA